jgi:hypothetical protein
MKKCSYCGKEYDDSASVCATDGKRLETVIRGSRGNQADPNSLLPIEIRHNRIYLLRWLVSGVFFVLLGLLIWSPPLWTRFLGTPFIALGAVLCWYAGRRVSDKRVKLLITTNGLTYYAGKRSTFLTWREVDGLTLRATTRTGLRYTSAKIIIRLEKNNNTKEVVINVLGLDPGADELFEILKSAMEGSSKAVRESAT